MFDNVQNRDTQRKHVLAYKTALTLLYTSLMHTLLLPGEVHKSEKSNNCYEKLIVGASSEYKSAFQTLSNLAYMSGAGLQ